MDRQRPTGVYTDTPDEQRPLAPHHDIQQPLVNGGNNPYHSHRPVGSTSPRVVTHHAAGGPIAEHHIPVAISPRVGGPNQQAGSSHQGPHIQMGSFHPQGERVQVGGAEYRDAPIYNAGGAYKAPYPGQHHHHPAPAPYPAVAHHGLNHGAPHVHHHAHPGTAGVVSSAPAHYAHRDIHGHDAGHVGLLVAVLALCSLVLIVQASTDCDKRGNPWDYRNDDNEWRYQGCVGTNVAYAVALAVISFVFTCAYVLQLAACPSTRANSGCVTIRKIGVTILMILWMVGAFLCTFDGPYWFLGNGYYALWIGCFASVIAFGRFVLYKGLHENYYAAGFDGYNEAL